MLPTWTPMALRTTLLPSKFPVSGMFTLLIAASAVVFGAVVCIVVTRPWCGSPARRAVNRCPRALVLWFAGAGWFSPRGP